MRKLLLSPLVLLALNVCGQAPQTTPMQPAQVQPGGPPGMVQPEYIVALQTGTETLKDGKDTIHLSDQSVAEMKQAMAKPDYTVMLTPRGETGQINIIETKEKYALVKAAKGASKEGSFDYVIFVKQRRPMMPPRPQRPPMPGGQPGGLPQPGAPGQPTPPPAQH